MRNFFILAVLSVAVLFGGIQLRGTWQAAQNRAELAQSWSTDDVQTTAVGTFNNTILVTLADNDPIECDVMLGNIISDHQLSQEIKAQGFSSIQCGQKKVDIR
jgi:hypothetical protein